MQILTTTGLAGATQGALDSASDGSLRITGNLYFNSASADGLKEQEDRYVDHCDDLIDAAIEALDAAENMKPAGDTDEELEEEKEKKQKKITAWIEYLRKLYKLIQNSQAIQSDEKKNELLKRISDAGGTPPEEIPDPPAPDIQPKS